MFPDKYVNDLKSSRRKRNSYKYFSVTIVFFFTALFGGQILHETTHIFWLQLHGCHYSFSYGFGSGGLYGAVNPGCFLNKAKLTVFYTSGYIVTLAGAAIFGISGMVSDSSTKRLAASSGFLMSVLISITVTGDFERAASALEISGSFSRGLAIFTALGVLISTLKLADIAFERLER